MKALFTAITLSLFLTNSFSQSFETQKKVYSPGEEVVIKYSDFPGNNADWISVVPEGTPDNQYVEGSWSYLEGNTDGEFSVNIDKPGKYEIKGYFDWPKGEYNLRVFGTFWVIDNFEDKTPASGKYCYTYSDLTTNETLIIDVNGSSATGTLSGIVKDHENSYFATWDTKISGNFEGATLDANLEIDLSDAMEIMYEKEKWTVTPSRIYSKFKIYTKVSCK